MNDYLKTILENKKSEIEKLDRDQLLKFPESPRSRSYRFKNSLSSIGFSVIAEIKRRSPTAGIIDDQEIYDRVEKYLLGGANAISVLTENTYFGAKPGDIALVKSLLENTRLSLLRKDFIVDLIQIPESAAMGADAILLIVKLLGKKLGKFISYAHHCGLDALVEVHDEHELAIALAAGAEIIGVNNRDLTTFQIDVNRSLDLIKHIPSEIIKVAESGIHLPQQASDLRNAGFDAILVGEALMRSQDPGNLIAAYKGSC